MFLVLILVFSFLNFENCFGNAMNLVNEEVEIQEPETQKESCQLVVGMRRLGTDLYFLLENLTSFSCEKADRLKAYLMMIILSFKGSQANAKT